MYKPVNERTVRNILNSTQVSIEFQNDPETRSDSINNTYKVIMRPREGSELNPYEIATFRCKFLPNDMLIEPINFSGRAGKMKNSSFRAMYSKMIIDAILAWAIKYNRNLLTFIFSDPMILQTLMDDYFYIISAARHEVGIFKASKILNVDKNYENKTF